MKALQLSKIGSINLFDTVIGVLNSTYKSFLWEYFDFTIRYSNWFNLRLLSIKRI